MKLQPAHRAIFEGDDACASALVATAFQVYGSGCVAWEPETLRLELIEDGVDVPRANMDALLAAFTLRQSDAFFWDPQVFAQTCLAFNQLPCAPEAAPELTLGQLLWTLDEVSALLDLSEDLGPYFDTGPLTYLAVCLHHAGLVWAPGAASFANEVLEELAESDVSALRSEVKKRWGALDTAHLRDFAPAEDPAGVQLALCASAEVYRQDQASARDVQAQLLESV